MAQSTNFFRSLNYVKYCNAHAVDEGCWSWSADAPGGHSSQSDGGNSLILHNGVSIIGLTEFNTNTPNAQLYTDFFVDINGTQLPSQQGVDQLRVVYCFSPQGCGTGTWLGDVSTFYAGKTSAGSMFPHQAGSVSLWNSLWK